MTTLAPATPSLPACRRQHLHPPGHLHNQPAAMPLPAAPVFPDDDPPPLAPVDAAHQHEGTGASRPAAKRRRGQPADVGAAVRERSTEWWDRLDAPTCPESRTPSSGVPSACPAPRSPRGLRRGQGGHGAARRRVAAHHGGVTPRGIPPLRPRPSASPPATASCSSLQVCRRAAPSPACRQLLA